MLKEISATPAVYYGFIAAQLIVMCILLNVALAKLDVVWRTLAVMLAIYASGTAIVFVEAVYPERNIVFLLVILIVALQRFEDRPSRLNMATALVAAHAALLQGASLSARLSHRTVPLDLVRSPPR